MATFWDEGLVTSVYRLQALARTYANAGWIDRAAQLERDLKGQWFPIFGSIPIKSDALALGEEIAKATGTGAGWGPNVLYEEDRTLGGRVGTVEQEAVVSGDIGANIGAFGSDVATTVEEEAHAVAAATPVLGHQLAIYGKWLLFALAVLVVFYVYERAKR
jgi:hypothetical protein